MNRVPFAARLACSAVFLLNGFGLANWAARIPDVQRRHALSELQLGSALLFVAVGALLGIPAAGRMIARVRSPRSVAAFASLFAAALALVAFAPNAPLFLVALVLLGFGNGGLDVAMNAQAVVIERAYGRPILSSFHALWSVGGLAGAAIAGILAGHGVPFPEHLTGAGLLIGAGFLPATRFMLPGTAEGAAGRGGRVRPTVPLLLLGIVAFCALVAEGAVGDWSALYLRKSLGTTAGFAATGFAAFQGAMATMRFLGDGFTGRYGPARIVRLGGCTVAVGLGAALVWGEPWAALVGFGCVGLGVAVVFPIAISAAGRLGDVPEGAAIAWVAGFAYTGFLAGPPLIGFVAQGLGLRVALGTIVLAGVVIAALASATRR